MAETRTPRRCVSAANCSTNGFQSPCGAAAGLSSKRIHCMERRPSFCSQSNSSNPRLKTPTRIHSKCRRASLDQSAKCGNFGTHSRDRRVAQERDLFVASLTSVKFSCLNREGCRHAKAGEIEQKETKGTKNERVKAK